MCAIHGGKIDLKFMLEFVAAFPVLINYQCRALEGFTPLILTVLHGTLEEVARMLAIGADARLPSSGANSLDPLEWAINARREEVFHLLFVHRYATSEAFELHLVQYYSARFWGLACRPPAELPVKKEVVLKGSSTLAPNVTPPKQPQSYQVNYQLLLHLLGGMIRQIKGSTASGQPLGAILILLPSYSSISRLRKLLISELATSVEHQFAIFCLYPHLPNNELEIALNFLASEERTQVRIILSTLSLDSLLLADVRYVLNTGVLLGKVHSAHCAPASHYRLVGNGTSIETGSAQVSTRYGSLFDRRSSMVYFYNLFWKGEGGPTQNGDGKKNELDPFRTSSSSESDCIYECIFALESLNLRSGVKGESIRSMFEKMVSHPPLAIVDRTVQYLKVSFKNIFKFFY